MHTCGNGERRRERLQSEITGGPDLHWMSTSPPNPNCIWDSESHSSYSMKSQNGPRISPKSSSPTSSCFEDLLVPASVARCVSVNTHRNGIPCSSLSVRGHSVTCQSCSFRAAFPAPPHYNNSSVPEEGCHWVISIVRYFRVSFFRKDSLPFMWQQNTGSLK